MKRYIVGALFVAAVGWLLCGSFASPAFATFIGTGPELVTDGGFESDTQGVFIPGTRPVTPWVLTGAYDHSSVAGGDKHSGVNYANIGPYTSGLPGYLTQTIATTAGASYVVDFWWKPSGTTNGDLLQVFWGGTGGTKLLDVPNGTSSLPYIESNSLVTATGSSMDLVFKYNAPVVYWRLDDVSVKAIPEPSTLALLAAGLAGLLCYAWRKWK